MRRDRRLHVRGLIQRSLGEEAPAKAAPRMVDNTRKSEATAVEADDKEILADEADDEFASYFSDEIRLLRRDPAQDTTHHLAATPELLHFSANLMRFFP